MKKRKQHYVWRHYLKPWSAGNKIFCLRDGKVFEPNLMGVANERDFYRLKELTQKDVDFIENLAIKPSPAHLQKLHANLVRRFNSLFKLKSFVQSRGIDDPELNERIEEDVNNLEEDLHGRIENGAIEHLSSILHGDIDFFGTDQGCIDFVYFMCVQYMRTKKIKSSVISTIKGTASIDLDKIWNVLSHIFATNMGWSLYADRSNLHLILLDNQSPVQFITGDQPVINSYATGDLTNPPQQLEFYYPVSPTVAVLLTEKGKSGGENQRSVGPVEATVYNEHIVRNRHEQIYAASKVLLERYIH
ncbi:MAG: DUF4238 domain-containing protein [Deltaproteobacteria bacterium]|nr:DUF4238 domain-containing protein [Deltaproteobacteria bacterium]